MKLFDESGITQIDIDDQMVLQVNLQKFKGQEKSKFFEKSDINNDQKETGFVARYGHSHQTTGTPNESWVEKLGKNPNQNPSQKKIFDNVALIRLKDFLEAKSF